MMKKQINLICNAHLDPVWLWEWEEGAAEAVSTFRVAADFCDKFDGFVFNHNEAILYQWVEEYEPSLFKRIQELVKKGKWHIMGGWYLQPDCNMPSGESFIRQILLGRQYFKSKFNKVPTTAINFDPFGHTQGLVQILAKSGYDSYLFCRPGAVDLNLPQDEFVWQGYDGSQVMATRLFISYTTLRGQAAEKVEKFLDLKNPLPTAAITWGIGNHGGGPSEIDLKDLSALASSRNDVDIIHATPEKYFAELSKCRKDLPIYDGDLNPWAVGCYTSQIRIKQLHRKLENELYLTEKMLSHAWKTGIIQYPEEQLKEVMQDLCYAEFHDILPGSSIQTVEETSLRLMNHAMEILSRLKTKAFFVLSKGQPKAKENEIPILVYNPHPYPVTTAVECEFQLQDQNWDDSFTMCQVKNNAHLLPTQVEQENSHLNLDWRKKIIFYATLQPAQMNRFDCTLQKIPKRPMPTLKQKNGLYSLGNEKMGIAINRRTGLVEYYKINGRTILTRNAFRPLVIDDNEDSWGSQTSSFRKKAGAFKLMSSAESAVHTGIRADSIPSVRVVEQGAVRTVIEASFKYGDSFLLMTYKIPVTGTEIEIEVRVTWNEKDKMLKLSLPSGFPLETAFGQTAFGFHSLPLNGQEIISQKWLTANSEKENSALRVIDDGIYGCDIKNNELRLSLMRSPIYSGLPIAGRNIAPQDRFTPRIDQGERIFKFWIDGGTMEEINKTAERTGQIKNECPVALSFFPDGSEALCHPGTILNGDPEIIITACKKAEKGQFQIIRLYNASKNISTTTLSIADLRISQIINCKPFEVRTFKLDINKQTLNECNMMEQVL